MWKGREACFFCQKLLRCGLIKLVAFDMDGVLTEDPSSWHFVHRNMGIDNSEYLELYRKGKISYQEFLNSDISLWISSYPGITKGDIVSLLRKISIRRNIPKLVETLRDNNIIPVIISGGISWLSDLITSEAEFYASYANVVRVDDYGRILPEGVAIVDPRHKDNVLRGIQLKNGIDISETASVGDSSYDISLFRCSSLRIAFSPNSESLVEHATHIIKSGELLDVLQYFHLS